MANWWENDPVAQSTASGQAAEWWEDDPVELDGQDINLVDESIGALTRGWNRGMDAFINTPYNVMRAGWNKALENTVGPDTLSGYRLPEAQPVVGQLNVTGAPQTALGRITEAVGEVGGASALPSTGLLAAGRRVGTTAAGILGQYARSPGAAAALDAASAVGAGGGVGLAREADLGPAGEIALGVAGGVLAPNAANIAARTYGGVRSGLQYGNRQIRRARDPETAAYRDVADQSVKAGLDLQDTLNRVAPQPSAQLRNRNTPQGAPFSADDMADIVSRRMAGEAATDIAQDYGLHPTTVQRYVDNYQAANPTPRNLIDIAKEDLGTGGASPLTNQARADMAIADDPIAADRLIRRQRQQPGRTADIIEQSNIDGRNLDEQLDYLATTARGEETAAYNAVRENAQPINIEGVIRNARRVASTRGGEIGKKLNEAIDLFFQPELRQRPQSPTTGLRIAEAEERLQEAISRNASQPTINRLRRRLRVAREQDEFSRAHREQKVGQPIQDVSRFIDARQELSQMTQRSMQDGRPTPLTRELTRLREELNTAARRNNEALTEADARYSGNRGVEALIQRGGELGKKLTPQTRRRLREFRNLTGTQQEVVRAAFEQKMASEALGVRRGSAAADQFNTDAFEQIINALYPQSAGRDVYNRGQALLRNLRGESISTETTRDILSGSRTAPMQDDIAELMEGPRAAADLATGRFGQVLENLSNRLARQIGQRAARERIRIVTETEPAQMLPILRRLAQEARDAGERQAYEAAIREFAGTGRLLGPAVETGLVSTQAD